MIRRSLRLTLATLMTLLLLLAAGLVAVRLLLPQWDGLAALVEQRVGAIIDREVQLGSLDLGWSGWAPELVASGVSISVPGADPLEADELGVSLAPLRSLRALRPVLGGARLTGTSLHVHRDADGRWDVHGWRFGGVSLATDWARYFAGLERLQIQDARLRWSDAATGMDTALQMDSLQLLSDQAGLRLVASGNLLPEAGGAVYVGIEIPPAGPDHIDFFLDARDLQLPYWSRLGGRLLQGRIDGTGSVRLWATMDNGRVRHIHGEHDTRLLVLRHGRWQVQPVGHRFRWQRRGHEVVSDWAATTPGSGNARLEYSMPAAGAGVDRLTVAAADVDVHRYAPWAAGLQLRDTPGLALLQPLDPSGSLERLYLVLVRDERGWHVDAADADIRDLELHATGAIPGVRGLDASLEWADGQAVLSLDGNRLRVEMPALFEDVLWLERLQAELLLQYREGAWTLQARELFLESEDATVDGRGRVEFGDAPQLDIALRFLRADGHEVARYLPVRRLPAKTYRWLAESIRAGRVTEGGMVFRGNPREFPFAENQGVFDLRAVVEDGLLDYRPGWPEARDLSGVLLFHNAGFRAEQASGRILDSAVSDTTVVIANMLRESELEIRGQARGSAGDLRTYLRDAGITGGFGPFLDGMEPPGSSELDLDLRIPLRGVGPKATRAAGRVRLSGTGLQPPGTRFALRQIEGEIQFDPDTGIRGRGIRAQLHDETVVLDLQRDAAGRVTRIDARGRQPIAPWVGEQAGFLATMQGRANWNAEVVINAAGGSRLLLTSNLEGLQIDLPAPLAKTMGTRRPLQIVWPLQERGEAIGQVRFDEILEADVRIAPGGVNEPGEIRALALNLGRPLPARPELPGRGINLRARLDSVDVNAWLAALTTLTAGALPIETASGLELVAADIEAMDHVRWGDEFLPGGRLRLEARDGGRWLGLDSQWVQGEARVTGPPAGDATNAGRSHWRIDLERLHLDQWQGSPAQAPMREGVGLSDPRVWPALDLRIADLHLGNLRLADVDLTLVPHADGVELRQLLLSAPGEGVRLQGEGNWMILPGGSMETNIAVEASGADWGAALASMGISPAMEEGSGSARLVLSWPGPLYAPDVAGLRGTVVIDLADGRLREVEPGAGRLLGLVTLDFIPRRLRLDFRDVYTQGLAFDQLVGEAVIDGGEMLLPELQIRSPAAVVRVSGRTGLVARDFDQSIVVVPRIRSTLPIVGALLGGPLTGAVVLLVERALGIGDQMEEAARVEYFVTGPWSDPEVRARVRTEQ
jgi:uncharacterized protein (TIGR02099 family)